MSEDLSIMKLWTLFFIFITALIASSFQASNAVKLSSSVGQSGRNVVCLDEAAVYTCSSYSNSIIWNMYHKNGEHCGSVIFATGDRVLLSSKKCHAVAILRSNTPMNLSSQLIVPSNWSGMVIECIGNESDRQSIYHFTARSPKSPTSIWYTKSTSEQFVSLHWSLICDKTEDCNSIKIEINGTNRLIVTYPSSSAVLNISDYLSTDSIEVKLYVVNKCKMVSTPSTTTVTTGDITQDTTTEKCLAVTLYVSFAVGGLSSLIALVTGALLSACLCRRQKVS